MQTLAEKVQQYEMDTGSLPESLDALVANPGNAAGWLGPYAKPAELKDPWNHAYEYRVPGEGQAFDLIPTTWSGRSAGIPTAWPRGCVSTPPGFPTTERCADRWAC